MRKVSILLAALALISGCVSCGNATSDTSSASSQVFSSPSGEDDNTDNKDEIIEVDPFKDAFIEVPDTAYSNFDPNIYPNSFIYFPKSKDETMAQLFESPVYYDATITESNIDSAKVHISLHEYPASEIEEKEGIKLVPTEQDFIIDVKKYRMSLVSETQLTDENINGICEGIRNYILSNIELKTDANSSIDEQLEIVKCYASDFEEPVGLEIGSELENAIYAIFKNNDDQYFLASAMPMFVNEKFEDEFTEYEVYQYTPEGEFSPNLSFPSSDDAEKSIKQSVHEIKFN